MEGFEGKKYYKGAISFILIASITAGFVYAANRTTTVQAYAEGYRNTPEEDAMQDIIEKGAGLSGTASDKAQKEETVYVIAGADGNPSEVIVSEWLKNLNGENKIQDYSNLNDITNVKGYEDYTLNKDGSMVWNTDGKDIYYQGSSEEELPIGVRVTYRLDGRRMEPDEIKGKSGQVEITYEYINNTDRIITVDGKKEHVKVPFTMLTGVILPNETFSDVEVENARLFSEGNNTIILGYGFPGLYNSLKYDEFKDSLDEEKREKAENLDIPDHVTIRANVKDFELKSTMTVALPDVLQDVDFTDNINTDDIKDDMDELADATEELLDGTREILDGVYDLKDGTGEMRDGVSELKDGTRDIKDGTEDIERGSKDLMEGAWDMREGACEAYGGSKKLYDGTKKVKNGLGDAYSGAKQLNTGAKSAVSQLSGMISFLAWAADPPAVLGASRPRTVSLTATSSNTGASSLSSNLLAVRNTGNALLTASLSMNTAVEALRSADILTGITGNAEETVSSASLASEAAENTSEKTEKLKEMLARLQDEYDELGRQIDELSDGSEDDDTASENEIDTEALKLRNKLEGKREAIREVIDELKEVAEAAEDAAEAAEGAADAARSAAGSVSEASIRVNNAVESMVSANSLNQRLSQYVISSNELSERLLGGEEDAEEESVSQNLLRTNAIRTSALRTGTRGGGLLGAPAPAAMTPRQQELLNGLAAAARAQQAGDTTAVFSYLSKLSPADLTFLKTATAATQLAPIFSDANLQTMVKAGLKGLAGTSTQSSLGRLTAGAGSLEEGIGKLYSGSEELKDGMFDMKEGMRALSDGGVKLYNGSVDLHDGTVDLDDGAKGLNDGMSDLVEGSEDLDDGVGELLDGVGELHDGMIEFDEEGVQKLIDLFGDSVSDMLDRLDEIKQVGAGYQNFSGKSSNTEGSVKFILKTEEIKQD